MPNRATTTTLPRTDLNGWFNEAPATANYLALQVMPGFTVPDKTGNIKSVPVEAMLTLQNVDRAPGGEYPSSDHMSEEISYALKEYGHEQSIDDGEAKVYGDQYDRILAGRLRNILLLKQEVRVKDACHNTTTFPQSGNTGLAVTDEWDDKTNAIPIDNIKTAKAGIRARGGLINNLHLQVAWSTWHDLWMCNQIRGAIQYTITPNVPLPDDSAARRAMAVALGVKNIVVADAFYQSAIEGATPTFSDVWTNEYAFLYNPPTSQDFQEPCFARTLTWEEDGGLFTAEEYRSDARRSDRMRVRQWTQEKVLMTSCAYLFSNITT